MAAGRLAPTFAVAALGTAAAAPMLGRLAARGSPATSHEDRRCFNYATSLVMMCWLAVGPYYSGPARACPCKRALIIPNGRDGVWLQGVGFGVKFAVCLRGLMTRRK